MNTLRVMFAGGASYVAMTSQAHADPISLIATSIHGFLLSSTAISAAATGAIATIAAYGIVGGALIGASLLGRQRPSGGAVNPTDAKSTFETGNSSVMEGIGRVRVGGLQAFGNTDGFTRARLVCRLQGPIDAVEQYFLGGREVTVEGDGAVSSPPWTRPGASWANWQDRLGTGSETAWPGLASLFPSLWTVDHRARGIAQSQLLFYNPGLAEEKYLSLYQNGAPGTEWVCRASKIFDPRTGNTAWSDNGILVCAHVLRRDPAFDSGRFDWDLIASEADKADVLVATRTGTEKRARAWGIWAWESGRAETMQQLLDSIGAEIRMTAAGKIWFQLIDDAHASEIGFTPDDGYEIEWRSGPEAVERPNTVRVEYYSPERNFEMAEIDLTGIAWASVADEVENYGPKYLDIKLPFCPSASQAQRIARRLFGQARGDVGSIKTNMTGLAAWGLLYGTVTLPDLGDEEKVRFAPPRIDDEQGAVDIPFGVWPDLPPWNPASDEAAAPDVVPELGYESDMITPTAPNAAYQITFPGGGKELRVSFSLPAQPYDTAEATVRSYTGGLPNGWQSMTEYPGIDSATYAAVGGDFLGLTIDARVRVFDGDEGSYFSPYYNAVVGTLNTAIPVPDVVGTPVVDTTANSVSLTATVKTDYLHVASMRLRRRHSDGFGVVEDWNTVEQVIARPGIDITFSNTKAGITGTVEWTIDAVTSDGTGGAELYYSGSTTS